MNENKDAKQIIILILVGVALLIGFFAALTFMVSRNAEPIVVDSDTTTSPTATPKVEENIPKLTDRTVIMETNFGTLRIKMLDKAAPKTTENFIRLSNKGYYNGLKFHRIAEGVNFNIIQGGDPLGNGRGGESVFGSDFEDEIYKEGTSEFIDPSLYPMEGDFAVYKKGYVAMANRGPDTNGSQFFIMLDDTRLQPNYTIFGKIDEADFGILDQIAKDVKAAGGSSDGTPNKEIKIVEAKLD